MREQGFPLQKIEIRNQEQAIGPPAASNRKGQAQQQHPSVTEARWQRQNRQKSQWFCLCLTPNCQLLLMLPVSAPP
jgi:hypothetical protein